MDLEALLAMYDEYSPLFSEIATDVFLTEATFPKLTAAIPSAGPPGPIVSLAGVPIRFDPDMPDDVIELRRSDGSVAKRIALAH